MEARADADAKSGSNISLAPSLPALTKKRDMYIVQFPKDQIYRVPPRQNALILEKYRNPHPQVKRRRCPCFCTPRLILTIAFIILSIIAILGITFAILYFIFHPAGPTFTLTNFLVKNSPPQYQVLLTAKNPNRRLGLEYEGNDDVWLMFGDTKVGGGKFPKLKQGLGALTEDVKVDLGGSNEAVPKEMTDAKSNTPVELALDMKIGLKIISGRLTSWLMSSNVDCKFKVRGLGNDTTIFSQQCHTNFKLY